MKEQDVNAFIAANEDRLPADEIANLRNQLMAADEAQFAKVQAVSLKNPTVILVLAIFFGWLGLDRFMTGKVGLGVVKLITCGGCWIWTIIDWFTAKKRTRQYNYNKIVAAL